MKSLHYFFKFTSNYILLLHYKTYYYVTDTCSTTTEGSFETDDVCDLTQVFESFDQVGDFERSHPTYHHGITTIYEEENQHAEGLILKSI